MLKIRGPAPAGAAFAGARPPAGTGMNSAGPLFADRAEAGRRLARAVAQLELAEPVVLALPRGGVPVALEVARALKAPLGLMLVRKISAPGHPEYAIGAVAGGIHPQTVLDSAAIAAVEPPPGYVEAESARQLAEIERRRAIYLRGRAAISVANRIVVLVDDGIATGNTAKAAVAALRADCAATVVLAVPVAPASAVAALKALVDRVVCLATPDPFHAVSLYYADFAQVTDGEVVALLAEAGRGRAACTAP